MSRALDHEFASPIGDSVGSPVTFDPGDQRLVDSPESVYARLRTHNPRCRAVIGGEEALVISRYDDVALILNDANSLVRPAGAMVPPQYHGGPAETLWRNAVSMMDPPDHTRLRRILTRAFTRQRIEGMRDAVRAVVTDVFDDVVDARRVDVVQKLSMPIPMRVIGELLGIPEYDWPELEAWTNDALHLFVPDIASAGDIQKVQSASGNFIEYFRAMIESRRRRPRDDLTSLLTSLHDTEGGLSQNELIGALRGLLTAGIETTAATLSASIAGLAAAPQEFEALRAGRVTSCRAVEELLRWESPVQLVVRYLGEAICIDGESFPAGTPVWCLLGAANYDPDFFPEAGRLLLARPPVAHHAFGGGRHFCLGAMLARLELQLSLEALVDRFSRVTVHCETLTRRPQFQFRSIQTLEAEFEVR